MKKWLFPIVTVIVCSAFLSKDPQLGSGAHDSFHRGEKLKFNVKFGIFSIGEAEMVIDEKAYKVNHRTCYKVDVYGRTSGMVDWIAKVDDHWGAYVDSAALIPHIAYRNIKEGNYRKNEVVRFDHQANLVETKVIDKKTGKFKEPMVYIAPEGIRDIMAGALYLRSIDFTKMKKGERFSVSGFFEDAFYDLELIFLGKDEVKTKAGRFHALKLAPIIPENELFDGEDSVLLYISDDLNKLPLKVVAKMFIGNTAVELESYANIKNEMSSLIR